ncbi:MAG: site-2 protease family protein [Syntrophorhabdales bacterium]|jgi:Zn-dependent protease/predicted transcriptional regulator
MFGRQIKLFRLLGFTVNMDVSWLVIAVLIVWSLAAGLFPVYYKGLPAPTYWSMGIAGTLGLFVSIVFHEFWHSFVARRYGLPISGITLFIFGGVSEMAEEPRSPGVEFFMAIAGPLSSFALAGFFYLVVLASAGRISVPVGGVLLYLASINGLLGIFNLLPAFPLDGGRVLRSILWLAKGNLQWATRIASRIGAGFGIAMILMGVLTFMSGNFISGLWWFLIGMFLRNASQMSYRQLLIRRALEGEHVNRFMKPELVTVNPSVTLSQLMDNYVYRYHYKMFPVVESDKLLGVVTIDQLKEVPRDQWNSHTVKEIADTCTEENTIEPSADATKALEKMSRKSASRLMVVDRGKLVGILALRDLLKFLAIKLDFEPTEA